MYKKILAAVNEFTNSEMAARYAIALSRSCEARLFLVFVAEEKINRNILRHVKSSLDGLFIEAKSSNVEVESVIERGDPFKKITGMVKENNIDILFTATRREDITKRFFVKTLAREFIVKLPCSVAMVRVVRMGKMHPKRILVPLRGHMTGIEERAFFVAKLAQAFDSAVTLFHTTSPIKSFFHGEIYLKAAQREEHIPKDMERFIELLNKYEIIHEKRTGHGRIARAITIEAALRRDDLVVMGASERSLLSSLIRGNPMEDVLRETPCNLVIFRPRHEHQ
ncbi:MAG: universal stress protein [Nitrospirota bacterium]